MKLPVDIRVVGAIAKLAADGSLPLPTPPPAPAPVATPAKPVAPTPPPKPATPPANVMAPVTRVPPVAAPATPEAAPAPAPAPAPVDVAANKARAAAVRGEQVQAGVATPPGEAKPFAWDKLYADNGAGPIPQLSADPRSWLDTAKAVATRKAPTPEQQGNLAKGFEEGLAADAKLPAGSPELAKQVATRQANLMRPEVRQGLATRFKDDSLLDPALSGSEMERKLGEHAGAERATKLQAALDANPSQGIGDLVKNNWQLLMIPLGLMMMTMGGKMGKILGLLAMAGGAANLYSRYNALKSPEFQDYAQRKADALTTPEEDQKFAPQWNDFATVSKAGIVNLPEMAKTKAVETVLAAQRGTPQAPAQTTPAPAPTTQAPVPTP